MIINFFETDSIISSLCHHFSIAQSLFYCALESMDPVHESAIELVKKIGIDLCTCTDELELVCRHITTCNDSLHSIKSNGLLTLDQVLCKDTPLNSFLSKFGISIIASEHRMTIQSKSFYINGYDEPCSPCAFGKSVETDNNQSVPFYNCCGFHQKMARLNSKLYHDKSEVEVYVTGSNERMLQNYTSILDGPEILQTIGEIISTIWKKTDERHLQFAWSKQKGMKRYILEFSLPLNAIETNTDHKYKAEYYDNSEWYEYSGFDYYDYNSGQIPMEFYRNKMLMELCFNSLFFPEENCYCQVLPYFHISPEMINVHKESIMIHTPQS